MNDFFKTASGRKFYEKDVPSLVNQLKRLGDLLEAIQEGQIAARIEEKKRFRIDQKRMINEAIEEYEKRKKENNGKI